MSNKKISVVKSLFNPEISDGLLIGINNYLDKNNLEDITLHLNEKNEKFTVMGKIIRK